MKWTSMDCLSACQHFGPCLVLPWVSYVNGRLRKITREVSGWIGQRLCAQFGLGYAGQKLHQTPDIQGISIGSMAVGCSANHHMALLSPVKSHAVIG